MLWDTYQQGQINSAGLSAERAERKSDSLKDEVSRLQRQVNHLTLACQSMWELLRDRTEFSETDLEAKILEIDLRDGRADGKIGTQVLQCPACGKNTNSKRATCIMCGAPIHKPHLFDG